ncbi:MAG: hypothetical protein JWM57_2705 [Phycisphaerales bacterium]|nr:hypothetical protein [Phycisphaerales bacterium]
MSQALRDLPDPMEPPPELAASSTDDLLAKMADEAIDRLIAEADKGAPAAVPPPPIEEHPPVAEETPSAEAAPESASEETTAGNDEALSAAEQAVADLLNPPEAPAEPAPVIEPPAAMAPPPVVEVAAPATVAGPVPSAPAAASSASAETPPAPAADVQALLQDAPETPSPLLLPLRLINSPFAFLSDSTRRTLGLIGIVTLVPALCAIAYVLYFKHHW